MRLAPFTPTKTPDLVVGTILIRKDDPFSKFRVVKEMKPSVIRGNTLKDEDGHPTGLLWFWPAYRKWSGEDPIPAWNLRGIAHLAMVFNFYTVKP